MQNLDLLRQLNAAHGKRLSPWSVALYVRASNTTAASNNLSGQYSRISVLFF
jgi:hypothetical protein